MPTREQLMQVIEIQREIAKLGLDLAEVMQFAVEQVLPLMGADGAAIELAEGDEMVYRAASGISKPQLGLRLRIDGSLSGLSVRTGEILTCADSETDPRVDRLACQKVGLRSMIVMPLKHTGTTVGVLKAMSARPEKFSQADVTHAWHVVGSRGRHHVFLRKVRQRQSLRQGDARRHDRAGKSRAVHGPVAKCRDPDQSRKKFVRGVDDRHGQPEADQ